MITGQALFNILETVAQRSRIVGLVLDQGPPDDWRFWDEAAQAINSAKLPLAVRPESGPMQFGEDWPGVFIRGDDAFAYAIALDRLLGNDRRIANPMTFAQITGLRDTLASCDTRMNPNPQKVPLRGPLSPAPGGDVDVPDPQSLQNPEDQ